jgi:ribosomal protein S1
MVVTEMDNIIAQANPVLYRAGQTVKGTVIDVTSSRILLTLEGGMTGIITKKEATGFGVTVEDVEIGSEIEAFIIDPENDLGLVALSLRRASQEMVWAELNKAVEEARTLKVKITEANKGGLLASYKGIRAFLPVSQLTPLNYPRVDGAEAGEILRRLQEHMGKDFVVRVLNADRENGKLIVSERAAYDDQKKDTLSNLRVGDIVEGHVSGVVKFGIFVTFGGAEGLVHLSELDWGHVSNPGKKYSLGDKVEVLDLGIENDKLSLSVKRLSEDPWKEKVADYQIGQKVTGKAIRWNSNGVFLEIDKDVTGAISLDQFGVEDHTALDISEGDEFSGEIDSINFDAHRIDLKKI